MGDPEALVTRWAREDYPDVEAAFARAREAIEREMGAVEETLSAHDPTLRAATASARGRALHQVDGLHEKALRALKKRDQGRAERLRRTRDALLPGGALQERGLGLVGVLARHGPARSSTTSRRCSTSSRAATRWCACEGSGSSATRRSAARGRWRPSSASSSPAAGHDIHVISYRLPFRLGDFQQNICFHEVDVSSYPLFEYPPHDLALAVKMAEATREHGLELFHVHYAIPHAIAGFLAQQMLGEPRAAHGDDAARHRHHDRRARTARSSRSRASGSSAPTR